MYSDPSQKLAVMSIGFLLSSQDDAVVWRGPKKNGIFIFLFFNMPYAYTHRLSPSESLLTHVWWH